MGAKWARNEVDATKRRCGLLVYKNDGSPAWRGLDFSALGYVFICGASSPDFVTALGTVTNQRRAFQPADDTVESVDTGNNTLELTGHAYETGDGPFVADAALGSVLTGTEFWIIVDDANNIAIAETLADAYADVRVALSGSETGATISKKTTTTRGIDGHFIYEATQGETNHDAPETIVIIDGSDYERSLGAGAYTTVEMESNAADWGAVVLEGGITRDDGLRLLVRGEAANFSVSGNTITHRDLADTKDSHSGTITSSGRSNATIHDPT